MYSFFFFFSTTNPRHEATDDKSSISTVTPRIRIHCQLSIGCISPDVSYFAVYFFKKEIAQYETS